MARPYQTNAADPQQVGYSKRKVKEQANLFLEALRATMATPAGRLVLGELVRRAGVFQSVWHSSALIHYNAGRQDYGHQLMADLLEADETLYQQMEREARDRARRLDQETEAAHTPRADRGGNADG